LLGRYSLITKKSGSARDDAFESCAAPGFGEVRVVCDIIHRRRARLHVWANFLCQIWIVQKIDHILSVLHTKSSFVVILLMMRYAERIDASVNTGMI